jgi:hypothetical protein
MQASRDVVCECSGVGSGTAEGVAAAEGGVGGSEQQQQQLQEALKLPLLGYSHMVYVCYKP